MESLSVPFIHQSWTEKYDGAVTARGVLRTEPDGLALEWRTEENYYGVKPKREGEIRTVLIPWRELQSIEYRRKLLLWGALVLRTRSLRALDGVPGVRGPEVVLTIAIGDRVEARGLAAEVALQMIDRRLDELGPSHAPSALPPA